MNQTLEQLRSHYPANYITVERLLQDHLPHIRSERHLRGEIRAGRLKLKLNRLHDSNRAPLIVYLTDLADFLDLAETAAANAA